MRKIAVLSALIVALAQPSLAGFGYESGTERSGEVPVLIDVFVMRPVGIAITVGGFVAWVVHAPWEAITRPMDMHKSFKTLVINPSRFTWVDPIGFHPDRHRADGRGEIR